MEKKFCKIDITGNWCEFETFPPYIQIKEPWPVGNNHLSFRQTMNLPSGRYIVKVEYDPFLDKYDGCSVDNNFTDFEGLYVNDRKKHLRFLNRNGSDKILSAYCRIKVVNGKFCTNLRMDLKNTRVCRTWIFRLSQFKESNVYRAVGNNKGGSIQTVHGIPFCVRKFDHRFYGANFESLIKGIDRGSLMQWDDGYQVDCGGARVKTAHFLGMIHNIDIANGSWYCKKGDNGFSHFVGDKVGEIIVDFQDGDEIHIPLVIGFNIWYGRPWDMNWHYSPYLNENTGFNHDENLFCGNESYREAIQNGVMLIDGIRLMGSNSCNGRYVFSLDLEGRAVKSFTIKGANEFYGYPLISGITIETEDSSESLTSLPEIYNGNIHAKIVSLDSIRNESYLSGVRNIMRILYTFQDEYPAIKSPQVPDGYFGPDYDFQGTQDAVYAASFLYRNGPENAAYIADSGTECRSSTANEALHHYTLGMGVWIKWPSLFGSIQNWFKLYKKRKPGNLPGCNQAWSRGIGTLLRETMAFGYDKYVTSYIDWLDKALFNESNPPHWNRIVGAPESCTYKVMVGEIEERGNRENDGHGICMWGRYLVWYCLGMPEKWNLEHWSATKASVEWIKWQLDNDSLRPGVRKDVLFTESECAYSSYDIYSSYNCLHGIKLAIRMAKQIKKNDEVKKWQVLYLRLHAGILENLTDESEYGLIWHTDTKTDWQDHAHKLVHIHLASDGDTYTPLQKYVLGDDSDRRYLEISINTYRYLMKDKNYNCLRMYGYGQGMMTQAALLLDEMGDAEKFIHELLRHCYLPRLSGWACPEGIIVHPDGEYYLPVNGYRGQDSHLTDSTKAIRLMMGIDDNNPEHLRFVPRYPRDWETMVVKEFPVITGQHRQKLYYKYERVLKKQRFEFRFEKSVDRFSIRFGPFNSDLVISDATVNGKATSYTVEKSGDSRWVWVENICGISGEAVISI